MSVINQKDYLKKYLKIGKHTGEKKKKKQSKKLAGKGLKIIDDDVSSSLSQEIQIDLDAANEDAPQIVAIIDDRPPSLRIDEKTKSNLWQPIGGSDVVTSTEFNSFKMGSIKLHKREEQKMSSTSYSSKNKLKNSPNSLNQSKHVGDFSPRNRDHYSSNRYEKSPISDDFLPPGPKKLSPSRDDDFSPPRRQDKNYSPPRRKDEDNSPPRRKDEDYSPPRKRTKDYSPSRRKDEDYSSPRRKNKDNSPPRRKYKDYSPLMRRDKDNSSPKRKDEDYSPPRRKNKDNSPPKRKDEDYSPPRKKAKDYSPPRREDKDYSPPRREDKDNSPFRREDKDYSLTRRKNKDNSPPRRKDKNYSPSRKIITSPWRNSEVKKKQDSFKPPRQKVSRWEKEDVSSKPEVTLSGKKSGLQNAQNLVEDLNRLHKQEEEIFRTMSADVSGVNAATVIRKKKEEKVIDPEKEARDKELKEKYSVWGKGLKQVQDETAKFEDQLKEMNKPMARYADDEDLEKYLKEQEREGDPMLAYIRKKKKKVAKEQGVPEKPMYMGDFMPNRYGIRPGYRWDGVDRSNGYETKWFQTQNSKKAMQDEALMWSTEDM